MLDKTPYTPGWKEVMRFSKQEAARLGHTTYIGPEHYLLGIIRKGDGMAVKALLNMQIDLEDLKMELERMLEVGKGGADGFFAPNAAAKRVMETAKYISQQMQHNWVGRYAASEVP
jgi:ATP-dependent Clp protease ATP-binding subunit ClpC